MSDHPSRSWALPPAIEAICPLLGRLTYTWGAIDITLDACNDQIYTKFGGREIEPVFPLTGFKRKVRFLRKCLNKSSELAGVKKEGRDLASQIIKLSAERHWIIHSLIEAHPDKAITLLKMIEGDPIASTEKKITEEALNKLLHNSQFLQLNLGFFLMISLRKATHDEINQFFRNVGIELPSQLKFPEAL